MCNGNASTPEKSTSENAQAWAGLDAEFALWRRAGRKASFWWRDDDAHRQDQSLDRLIDLSTATGMPPSLAVVPAWLEPSLIAPISRLDLVTIVQHGWQHVNHSKGSGDKGAWELGMHRGEAAVWSDVVRGRDILRDAFADQFIPIIAPPWNKFDPALFNQLVPKGFCGISAFGARSIETQSISGVTVNNCHCDPINWKSQKRFRGTQRTLFLLIEHLQGRRLGTLDPNEATGLLTHHLDMDEPTWAFTSLLLQVMATHPAVSVLSARDIFKP